MEAKVTWKSGLAFTGFTESGFEIPLDAAPEAGGQNTGSRPMELLAVGLAGCTAMDVISILKKKQVNVTAFEVRIDAERAGEHPKRFTKILIEYVVTGHAVDPAAVERAVELSETKYCSAAASLRPGAEIVHKITILEAR